jgi:uncharacterized protein (UPF0262 family)
MNKNTSPITTQSRIKSISLGDAENTYDTSLIAKDKQAAMMDLIRESLFSPAQDQAGPYALALRIQDNRLVIDMQNNHNEPLPSLILSLRPYKRLIQDYFLIIKSYDEALKDGKPSRIEAIDMGRRGLHNEGAALLMERLEGKIEMDLPTARRLFSLICVLHDSKTQQWR